MEKESFSQNTLRDQLRKRARKKTFAGAMTYNQTTLYLKRQWYSATTLGFSYWKLTTT
jgi:hypothetical protein